ncbi:MAG: [protein-PII] uridylyltransferase [Pedosphaera sp.]|nr:[protein-PII] uridylyltransferase [Pedosphaera sp.]
MQIRADNTGASGWLQARLSPCQLALASFSNNGSAVPGLLVQIESSAAARLSLPAGKKPSEELARYRRYLKVESRRLRILHRSGAGGLKVCAARAAVIDALLRHLVEAVVFHAPAKPAGSAFGFALVALGGYGRSELNPHSDIDLMFLHEEGLMARSLPTPYFKAIIDGVLYTLWDTGLKIGHSVRLVEDSVREANKDIQTKTSLMEARLVMGDAKLFDKLQKAVKSRTLEGKEDEYIVERLTDQAARRERYGNSVTLQEPNIKNGCGGLRDYQNLLWMLLCKHHVRTLGEMEAREWISATESRQLQSAYDFLLRARSELHYLVDRPADQLLRAVQPAIAYQLGYKSRSIRERVEAFMRDYYRHARHIDLIVRNIEQRLSLVPAPTGFSLRRLMPRKRDAEPQIVDGVVLGKGEITAPNRRVFRDQPRRLLRVFLLAQRHNLRIHPELTQMIRQQVLLVDHDFQRDEHVRDTFLEILSQRGNVARTIRQLHETGLLGKYLPEFGRLTCLVQHEFYHQYTVDEHTLVCIEKLDQLWDGKAGLGRQYRTVFEQIERPQILYLGLLLHDAGKGGDHDRHEVASELVAEKISSRLNLEPADAETLKFLVRHHLLMVQVSQRRDLEDISVIQQFIETVNSLEKLSMLVLLSVADSLGTSEKLWNGFKDASLWTLYIKAQQLLGGQSASTAVVSTEVLNLELSIELDGAVGADEIAAHLSGLPPRYFNIYPMAEIVEDIRLAHRFLELMVLGEEEEMLTPILRWHRDKDRGYDVLNICTWDRPGLFSRIAASLTTCGLNILSAQIFTRTDSVVLDRFALVDARTGLHPERETIAKFESVLAATLSAEQPPELELNKIAKAGQTYDPVGDERIPTVIEFDPDASDDCTLLDLQSEDHVGLLYVVSSIFARMRIVIHLAKICTEKGAATDTFYVQEIDGSKLSELRCQELRALLIESIDSLLANGRPSSVA